MNFAFAEGQDVMICVRGYEPRQGHVETAAVGGPRGQEPVYWVTFRMNNGATRGLWFSEAELQPMPQGQPQCLK